MRRSPLTRKTPLARGTKPLKRKATVSKLRRLRESEHVEFPKGVPFDAVRKHLPSSNKDWPAIVRVLNKPALRTKYLAFVREQGGLCPLCRDEPVSEVHHLVGGSRGRADERCNLLGIGHRCHREIQSVVSEYRRCWRAKLEQDPDGCDFIRLVLLLGYWPDFDSLD